MRKIIVLGIKNHRSAAVRGGARRVRPPPGSASDKYEVNELRSAGDGISFFL